MRAAIPMGWDARRSRDGAPRGHPDRQPRKGTCTASASFGRGKTLSQRSAVLVARDTRQLAADLDALVQVPIEDSLQSMVSIMIAAPSS